MLPYKNLIPIERTSSKAIYLQIVDAFTELIQAGQLSATTKLPSSRALSQLLGVHRNTITVAYEELEAQGWIEILPKRGAFVHSKIPIIKAQYYEGKQKNKGKELGYSLENHAFIEPAWPRATAKLQLNDGVPDIRLAPLAELGRTYRSILQRSANKNWLDYGDTLGVLSLREALLTYLKNTRGIAMNLDNILISRGSMMGLYLVAQTLLKPQDIVVVGRLNYSTANMIFQHAGATLQCIDVDENGIVVAQLERLCQQQKVRAIYVASHHHHPTTVTLSADRRIQLLELAQTYDFAIIEDDYDYDFHYLRNPILPLASIDKLRNVIYIGSLSKVLAPAFRVGFVVAHPAMIEQMSMLRRIIDRQGDFPLEKAIAELFQEGEIQRHIRKSLRIYQERRDCLEMLLKQHLNNAIQFETPNGGMAIWAVFDSKIDLQKTAQVALKKGLFFSEGNHYTKNIKGLQATRLGFASSTIEELEASIQILKKSIRLKS